MKILVAGPTDVASLADLTGDVPPVAVHSFPLTAQLTRAYVEAGHSVRVVVQTRQPVSPGFVYGNANLSVAIVPTRRAAQALPDWFRKEVAAVRDAIRAWKPDVVHAHWTYEYARGAVESGFPHVVTAHDAPTRLFAPMKPRYYWWPKLLQGFLIARRAQRMTAQSPYTLKCWKGEMRRKGPIELVPNGVAKEVLELGALPSPNLPSPLFVSICSGFGDRKNTKTLLRAMDIVRRTRPDARLRMYGADYGLGEAAEGWATSHALAEGVEFLGRMSQPEMLRALKNEASVLVHPAIEESFGMSIAETMALGLPVVAGKDSGAVPWLLDEGQAGLLCDVRSPDALALAMLQALERPEIGPIGRQRILDHFELGAIADRYLTILHEEAAR